MLEQAQSEASRRGESVSGNLRTGLPTNVKIREGLGSEEMPQELKNDRYLKSGDRILLSGEIYKPAEKTPQLSRNALLKLLIETIKYNSSIEEVILRKVDSSTHMSVSYRFSEYALTDFEKEFPEFFQALPEADIDDAFFYANINQTLLYWVQDALSDRERFFDVSVKYYDTSGLQKSNTTSSPVNILRGEEISSGKNQFSLPVLFSEFQRWRSELADGVKLKIVLYDGTTYERNFDKTKSMEDPLGSEGVFLQIDTNKFPEFIGENEISTVAVGVVSSPVLSLEKEIDEVGKILNGFKKLDGSHDVYEKYQENKRNMDLKDLGEWMETILLTIELSTDDQEWEFETGELLEKERKLKDSLEKLDYLMNSIDSSVEIIIDNNPEINRLRVFNILKRDVKYVVESLDESLNVQQRIRALNSVKIQVVNEFISSIQEDDVSSEFFNKIESKVAYLGLLTAVLGDLVENGDNVQTDMRTSHEREIIFRYIAPIKDVNFQQSQRVSQIIKYGFFEVKQLKTVSRFIKELKSLNISEISKDGRKIIQNIIENYENNKLEVQRIKNDDEYGNFLVLWDERKDSKSSYFYIQGVIELISKKQITLAISSNKQGMMRNVLRPVYFEKEGIIGIEIPNEDFDSQNSASSPAVVSDEILDFYGDQAKRSLDKGEETKSFNYSIILTQLYLASTSRYETFTDELKKSIDELVETFNRFQAQKNWSKDSPRLNQISKDLLSFERKVLKYALAYSSKDSLNEKFSDNVVFLKMAQLTPLNTEFGKMKYSFKEMVVWNRRFIDGEEEMQAIQGIVNKHPIIVSVKKDSNYGISEYIPFIVDIALRIEGKPMRHSVFRFEHRDIETLNWMAKFIGKQAGKVFSQEAKGKNFTLVGPSFTVEENDYERFVTALMNQLLENDDILDFTSEKLEKSRLVADPDIYFSYFDKAGLFNVVNFSDGVTEISQYSPEGKELGSEYWEGNRVEEIRKKSELSFSTSTSSPVDNEFYSASSPIQSAEDIVIEEADNEKGQLELSQKVFEYVSSSPATERVGGIDLNPAMMDLQILRDGNGVPLPVFQQPINDMKINGFLPVIIDVQPISIPFLLGMDDPTQDSQELTYFSNGDFAIIEREDFLSKEVSFPG